MKNENKPLATTEGGEVKLLKMPPFDSPKNWTEDAGHENGNYYNHCRMCKDGFYGHKRRVTCKICAISEQVEEKPEGESCIAGCNHYTGGEIKHHIHCPFYSDSLSRTYDEMEKEFERLSSIPQPEQPECTHEPLIDTGVGYHYCPACKESWKVNEQPEQTAEEIMDGVIKKHYPFYNPNIAQKDIEVNAESAKDLMKAYLSQYKASLIEKLEAELEDESEDYVCGIRKAIDLI